MNFRKLLTYLTMGTAAAMPIATAQNPTILQGNYITNVFGNSNFVLNPNAQTNIGNVTVSNATVTRSTTTPLVATSEFTVTTSTATGSATWSTRTFDAGMKNQNCEARFSYRGFSVGSTTAQILQGANVVAQLTLTASTDPRIASINFPCGDLSSATTFKLQQATASLTGTNEIGGIYVGLATNMANVAQASFVGGITGNPNTYATTTSTTFASLGITTGSFSLVGNATSTSNLAVTFNNLPAGEYQLISNVVLYATNGTSADLCHYQIIETSTGNTSGEAYITTRGTGNTENGGNITGGRFSFASTGNRTFEIRAKKTGSTISCNAAVDNSTNAGLYLYRFPLSSELVVTPERQNWYISAYHGGANPLLSTAAVTSRTEITNGSLSLTPTVNSQPVATLCSGTNAPPALSTSATTCAAGLESIGITFNIPSTGTYEVCAAFGTNVEANAASNADTVFSIEETSTTSATNITSNPTIPRYSSSTTAQTATTYPTTKCQLFNFSSLGQKAVRLMYMQNINGTVTQNLVVADAVNGRIVNWTVTPITNQSNSALYVQGPVLGAQTGAAIPAGYVGEVLTTEDSADVNATSATYRTITLNVTPGVWEVQSTCLWKVNTAVMTARNINTSITNQNNNPSELVLGYFGPGTTAISEMNLVSPITRVRWDGTTNITEGSTNQSSAAIYSRCYPGAWSSGQATLRQKIKAIRIN